MNKDSEKERRLKNRRLKFFRLGSKAISKYLNGDSSHYYCPICGKRYPEKSAAIGSDLTLEDVPPKSVGGRAILLTCRRCNSSAGHTVDASIAGRKNLETYSKIMSGQVKGEIPFATLSIEELNLAVTISSADSFDIKPIIRANAPTTIESYQERLREVVSNNINELEFKISAYQKYDHRFFKLSHLKSAFLLIFAWLGYRYAFDPRLEIVRQQIQEPESDILGTTFWIEGESIPSNKIMYLRNPFPVLLVSFEGFSVVLPSLESTLDVYDVLPNYWKKGQIISLEAKVLLDSWPTELQMKMDFMKGKALKERVFYEKRTKT